MAIFQVQRKDRNPLYVRKSQSGLEILYIFSVKRKFLTATDDSVLGPLGERIEQYSDFIKVKGA